VYVQRLFLTNNWKAKDRRAIKEYKVNHLAQVSKLCIEPALKEISSGN